MKSMRYNHSSKKKVHVAYSAYRPFLRTPIKMSLKKNWHILVTSYY